MTMRSRTKSLVTRYPLLAVLIPFVLLGTLYSLVTPPLEASDEFKHYPFTQYVQTEHDLPVLDPPTCLETPEECPWLQDGGQPPLYYMTMALLTSWIDTSDLGELRWMNWHAFIGDPSQIGNKNLHIHQREREAFPWRGATLAIHLIRFLSIGLGLVTVTLTYKVALELFPQQKGLALSAAALTAFTPMFLFVSGSVNNDTYSATIGNLALLLLIRLARKWTRAETQRAIRITDILPLSLTIGLYLLGKLSALGFLGLTGVVLTWISWKRRDWRPLVMGGATVIAVAALVAGWWFVRNYRLYGDLTALKYFVEIQGWRTSALTWQDIVDEFGTFRWTYWGLFGAVNVMAPRWVYTLFDVLSLAGLAGLALRALRALVVSIQSNAQANRRSGRSLIRPLVSALAHPWWIPALWALILFVSLIRWTIIFYSFQGRLMFPCMAGISTLLMVGLREWAPLRYRRAVSGTIALLVLGIAAMIPFVSIIPAYSYPEPLRMADVPESALHPPVDFKPQNADEPVIRLVGYQVAQGQVVEVHEAVELTLYWQALRETPDDLISYVNLLGRGLEPVAKLNRFPAMGMVPTSLWEPGQVWQDAYRIKVDQGVQGPLRLLIDVGIYDEVRKQTLDATDANGNQIGLVIIGQAKLAGSGPQAVEPALALDAAFGDGIRLIGADVDPGSVSPGQPLPLRLYWQADGTPSQDYTVFVHLLGAEPFALAQADGPPDRGDYPTSLWAAGETIVDAREILIPDDLAPGDYQLRVGMYVLETGERLPLLDQNGTIVGDHVELVALRVDEAQD